MKETTYVKMSKSLFLLGYKTPNRNNYYRVLNIGNQNIVLLSRFISTIEKILKLKTKEIYGIQKVM